MPRATSGQGPTAPPPTKELQQLLKARAEIDERLMAERERSRFLAELRAFLAKRPLIRRDDLLLIAKDMRARRAKRPVSTLNKGVGIGSPKPPKGALGIAINKAREAKGLSRSALADKIGCHNSLISHWERAVGKPGAALRPKISRVLGIDVEALIAREQANGHAAP